MNRLFEYTNLPSEKPSRVEGDEKYRCFALNLKRDELGTQRMEHTVTADGVIQIVRTVADGRSKGSKEVVLVQVPGQAAFKAPSHLGSLVHLCEKAEELKQTTSDHRVVAISGVRGDAEAMAAELLRTILPGTSVWDQFVKLDIQSDWLACGAEIRAEELRVGYGDIPRDILRDINFTIAPRTKVGIVGSTGCGKSTLMLSMLRIIEPRGGRIVINGVDTTSIGLATLRTSIGMVPQDPVLLAGTLRSSLDPFEFFTDTEIWHGLHLVQMADVVASMQWGLYQPLAQEGNNLSYGQRQLLCLARTVIRQPAIILLDEATSALDPNTQELVQKTIESAFPHSTLVVIAHRLETILNFDQVLVMDKGQIIEDGTVQELKDTKGGRFAQMLAAKKTW